MPVLSPVKVNEVKVVEVKERVRTLTKTIVKPDGTSITVIDQIKDTESKKTESRSIAPKRASVALSRSIHRDGTYDAVYGVTIQRELILGLSAGLYARDDKEVGLVLGYSF
jgi:hypothetical protein